MLMIAIMNAAFPGDNEMTIMNASLITLGVTAAMIAFEGMIAFIIRRMPEKYFQYSLPFYCLSNAEKQFLKSIGIKKWGKMVIELGMFTNFSKSHFTDPLSSEYTGRFLLESCYGIVIHIACIIAGFSAMAFCPHSFLRIGLPLALVNAFLNILPIFILRYNTPKIKNVHERNLRRLQRESSKQI